MKTIKIDNVVSTGLDPDFDSVRFVEIDDAPFAEGGFGRIFHVRSINGKQFKNPQVVKIFKDNMGSAAHSFKTIRGLQDGLIRKKTELDQLNIDFLDYYPAFFGAPQFVFEGNLDGDSVQGYSANNLKKYGYCCFSDVIEDDDTGARYDEVSMENRFAKAYHMMRAFTLLNEIRYIHADFKADNFFVSLDNDGRCALIDFDSGAIVNELEDEAFTVGTPSQNMLAPEIRRQINEGCRAKVNLLTDTWSVAVACNYLLFVVHPFDFLSEQSDNAVTEYNDRYIWPDVSDDFSYYNDENAVVAEYLQQACTQVPTGILECLRYTFTKGYFNQLYRTSYSQWCIKLKPHLPEGEARHELSKIRHDIDKKKLQEEERQRKEREERERLAKLRVKPEEYPDYISQKVMDLIQRKAFFNLLQPELAEVGEQLDIADLDGKVRNFVTAYFDVWADGVISNTERNKFKFLGKNLKMPERTVEYLLHNKI